MGKHSVTDQSQIQVLTGVIIIIISVCVCVCVCVCACVRACARVCASEHVYYVPAYVHVLF